MTLSSEMVLPRGAKKSRTIRLNILRSYGVRWDAQTLVRDLLQNFFDASTDFEGVTIDVDRARRVVRIEGPEPFHLDLVKYIGATTKAKGGFAGQFGEGFKICTLVALRDFDLRVLAGAGTWRIEPTFKKVRVGEELVYQQTRGPELPGSFVELQGCSPEFMDLITEGKRFFRWSGNPSFGECLYSDGDVHVYRKARGAGELYYGKQLRAELYMMPYAFCLDSTLKNIRRDRDRRNLKTNQVRVVLNELGTRLPLEVGMKIVNELEHRWRSDRSSLMWLIVGLGTRHHPTREQAWPEGSPDGWVAGEYGGRWLAANETARRMGFQVANSALACLGMRRAREVWEQTVQPVPDSELTPLDRARRLLLTSAGNAFYRGAHPPLHFARMTSTEGLHRKDETLLNYELLQGDLGLALSTYLHELCHEHGRDGDARFSDALTEVLQVAVDQHWFVAEIAAVWSGLARLQSVAIEAALAVDEPHDMFLALSELVKRRED